MRMWMGGYRPIGLLLAVGLVLTAAGCATPPPSGKIDETTRLAKVEPKLKPAPPGKPKGVKPGYIPVKTGDPYVVAGITYRPLQSSKGYVEQGIASWYGTEFHGRRTANGEIFDMEGYSAAHTTLPLPLMVRVTNLENGRQMDLRINDRGPFVKNRLIDLSVAAAKALGYYNVGTALVRVEALEDLKAGDQVPVPTRNAPTMVAEVEPLDLPSTTPVWRQSNPENPKLFIQVGAFQNTENARKLEKKLQTLGSAQIQEADIKGKRFYRVTLGPVPSVDEADRMVETIENKGLGRGQIVVR